METGIYLDFTEHDYKVLSEFNFQEQKQYDDYEFAVALQLAINDRGSQHIDGDYALALQLQEEEQKRIPPPISLAEQKLGQIHHKDGDNNRFYCPYGCGQFIEVSETPKHDSGVYCGIFRCGKMADGSIIPQHATDAQVEQWRKEGKLGTNCGRQFKMTKVDTTYKIEKCSNL